jgi:hypothetical protein
VPLRRDARARLARATLPAAALAAAALAAVVLAACTGGRREAGACDLGQGPCTGASEGIDVRLELSPRPLRSLRDLEVAAVVTRGGAPVEGADVRVELSMPGMYMGENRVALAPLGGGRYRGRSVLVRCASGRRDWVAEVALRLPGEAAAASRVRFPFEVAE